jgi:hypothetical protein
MNDKWVLLWSQSQCAYHIERFDDMLRANLQAYHENRRMDYVPIWVGTEAECDKAAEAGRVLMEERWEAKREAQEVIDTYRAGQ